jgi:hypothetical protein
MRWGWLAVVLALFGCEQRGDVSLTDASVRDGSRDGSSGIGWAVPIEGPGQDGVFLAVDSQGDVVAAGLFSGTATIGPRTVSAQSPDALFVAKLDPVGQVRWAEVLHGGLDRAAGYGVAVDAADGVYVSGPCSTSARLGDSTLAIASDTSLVVAKLGPTGEPIWLRRAASSSGWTQTAGVDPLYRVAIDSSGAITLAGTFAGKLSFGAKTLVAQGPSELFVARLEETGVLRWAVTAGGAGVERLGGMALDPTGNCFLTGMFSGTASFGGITRSAGGANDLFLAKLDPSCVFVAAYTTPKAIRSGQDLVVDPTGIYVAAFHSPGGLAGAPLVFKVDPALEKHVWSWAGQPLAPCSDAGPCYNPAMGLVVDGHGVVTAAGNFGGTLDLGEGKTFTATGRDAFLARLTPTGILEHAQRSSGPGTDRVFSLVRDRKGNLYVGGAL